MNPTVFINMMARMSFSEEVEKKAGHLYFKRTGTPGNYRHYYMKDGNRHSSTAKVAHHHLTKHDDYTVGASFSAGKDKGHWHIDIVTFDTLHIRNDETGEKESISKKDFAAKIVDAHKDAIQGHYDNGLQKRSDVAKMVLATYPEAPAAKRATAELERWKKYGKERGLLSTEKPERNPIVIAGDSANKVAPLLKVESDEKLSNRAYHASGKSNWWIRDSSGNFVNIGRERGDSYFRGNLRLADGRYVLGTGTGSDSIRQTIIVGETGKNPVKLPEHPTEISGYHLKELVKIRAISSKEEAFIYDNRDKDKDSFSKKQEKWFDDIQERVEESWELLPTRIKETFPTTPTPDKKYIVTNPPYSHSAETIREADRISRMAPARLRISARRLEEGKAKMHPEEYAYLKSAFEKAKEKSEEKPAEKPAEKPELVTKKTPYAPSDEIKAIVEKMEGMDDIRLQAFERKLERYKEEMSPEDHAHIRRAVNRRDAREARAANRYSTGGFGG